MRCATHRLNALLTVLLTVLLLGCSTAPASARPALSSHSGLNRSHPTGTVTLPPPLAGSILYDSSIGNGVDANGHADLPLRGGAHQFYLNSSTGSDANNCTAAQSPTTPKATVASVVACITDGAGDHIEIAEGTSYSSAPPDFSFLSGGFSFAYPATAESYDPTDPTNNAKHGTASGTGSHARPTFSSTFASIGGGQRYIAWRGLDINPGNIAGRSSGGTYVGSGLLIENNLIRYGAFQLSVNAYPVARNWIFRNNAIYGGWDGNQGIFVSGVFGLTLEDNVFYHNGWKIGASRDAADASGGADIFKHAIYQQHPSNGIIRRNLLADGSADCGTLRGDAIVQDNVYLYCPIGMGAGGGVRADLTVPFGDALDITHNVILDGQDLNSTNPRGWGISTDNGKPSSIASYNVFSKNHATSNKLTFSIVSGDGEQSYMTFDHNRAYQWVASGSTGPAAGANLHATLTNNVWDDPASGSNVNVSSVTFPNSSLDAAALATGAGYANYTALMNYAIANPEAHIQRALLATAMAAYGQTGPPLRDLAIDSIPWRTGNVDGGAIVGTQPESVIVSSGTWPTGFTIDPKTRFWFLDGTQTAGSGTGTLTETPAAGGTPHVTNIAWTVGAAPQLSSLTVTPGAGSATINVTTTIGNGPLYYAFNDLSNSDCGAGPCPAQYPGEVKGCVQSHYTIPVCGSQAVSASGVQTINVPSLVAGKDYYVSVMQVAASGVWSPTTDGLHALGPVHVVPTAASTVWSLANSTASVWALSGSNLIGTRTADASGGETYLRASAAKTAGTYKVTVSGISTSFVVAIGLDDGAETADLGGSAHSVAYYADGSGILFNGSNVGSSASLATSDQLTVTWNSSTHTVTFQKNAGTPVTYTNASIPNTVYPTVNVRTGGTTGQQFTLDSTGW
jgi:hypothetical protein